MYYQAYQLVYVIVSRVHGLVSPSLQVVWTPSVSTAGFDILLSVTGRRAALRYAPAGLCTPGLSSCLQGPPGCRRGDPSSRRRSLLCCHCRLGRKEMKQRREQHELNSFDDAELHSVSVFN